MTRVQRIVISLLIGSDAGILLLLRNRPYAEFPPGDAGIEAGVGLWELPGGGLDFGETPQQTAVREAFEETGIRVDERTLQLVSCCAYRLETAGCQSHRIHVIYEARQGTLPPVRHSEEHGEHRWIRNPEELRDLPLVEEIRAVVVDHISRQAP